MRFSLNFIQEFLKVDLKPGQLARKLTMTGMEVEGFERVGSDWAFDIEVTTNRYDWLSMVGISQEIAAVLGKSFKIKKPKLLKGSPLKGRKIIIEDRKDCPYYIGRSIKGVSVASSSSTIKSLIINCGLTSVNNIVDITNYCMLKWGNPLHAFDEDKLEGDIYIRRAKRQESFIGIDGKERVLDKNNLVIADQKKVVALAGVIGSKDTEVDELTKNVFLEAAIFSPLTVRRSRRIAGVDTESSYRFERRVSPDYLEFASAESAQLIEKNANGKLVGVSKAGAKPVISRRKISLKLSKLEAYLGTAIPEVKFKVILNSLGFETKRKSKDEYLLTSPAQRFDIVREVDVYEEVSRIYGYDKIPDKIPFLKRSFDSKNGGFKNIYHFNNRLANFVALLGFKEIISYSIEGRAELGLPESSEVIKIVNPLRKQENSLRSSLLPGMIKAARYNLNRNQSSLGFFEIAHRYLKDKKGFSETPVLAIGVSGKKESFFHLKGAVEKILHYSNNRNFKFKETKAALFSDVLEVVVEGKAIGLIGKVSESLRKQCDLKESLFFAQLDINQLILNADQKRFQRFSPYPLIFRDVSLCLDQGIGFKEVEKIIKTKSNYLAGLEIVDIYKGKDISSETTAFTLRIFYQSSEKTLTSQEVDTFHGKIREALSQQRGLKLR